MKLEALTAWSLTLSYRRARPLLPSAAISMTLCTIRDVSWMFEAVVKLHSPTISQISPLLVAFRNFACG
jgi:hypothetical protein